MYWKRSNSGSIKKYIPEAEVFASDISIKALQLARINNIDNNINFIESNLFENINNEFDIIVSNPPYIRTEEIKSLSKEVTKRTINSIRWRTRWTRFLQGYN